LKNKHFQSTAFQVPGAVADSRGISTKSIFDKGQHSTLSDTQYYAPVLYFFFNMTDVQLFCDSETI